LVELALVAHRVPLRVVDVLLAAALVTPRCEDVPLRAGADPHVGPRWRDSERVQPGASLLVAHQRAVRRVIRPAAPALPAGVAGHALADVVQPSRTRRLKRILDSGDRLAKDIQFRLGKCHSPRPDQSKLFGFYCVTNSGRICRLANSMNPC